MKATDIELGFPAVYIIAYWKQKEAKKFAAREKYPHPSDLTEYAAVRREISLAEKAFMLYQCVLLLFYVSLRIMGYYRGEGGSSGKDFCPFVLHMFV